MKSTSADFPYLLVPMFKYENIKILSGVFKKPKVNFGLNFSFDLKHFANSMIKREKIPCVMLKWHVSIGIRIRLA